MSSDKEKEAMGDHVSDEKTALKDDHDEKMVDGELTAPLDDSRFDDSKVKFVNGGATADARVDIEGQTKLDQEFIGLTKEELEEYAKDPFWVRVRWALFILFWVAWAGMLAAAIIIIVVAPRCPPRPKLEWYQKSVIYQVYPRSFQDTNGDGNGDLKGVTAHLKYLDDQLNTSTVWINSIYPSPNQDYGYDVSNFTSIHPDFGTLEDFKALLEEAHKEGGMKVILDFIPNHSSSIHPWFKASQKQTGDYKDYYVWHNSTVDNKPPNNWLSVYGGSAWTLDSIRGEYYLHQYGSEQPDLNLRNEKVLEELDDVLRFWLDLGVDGFRVHAAAHLVEGDLQADELPSGKDAEKDDYDYLSHTETAFQPETYELIARWRGVIDSYSNTDEDVIRVLLVEAYGTSNQTQSFYSPGGEAGAHLVSNMNLLNLKANCDGRCVYGLVDNWMKDMPEGAWETWALGNQDHSRLATRIGDDYVNLANMLLMTLPGTPTTYYGEEIGMRDVEVLPEQGKDPMGTIKGSAAFLNYSRDPERTPMQWLGKENAGFTYANATPWLPVGDDYRTVNVEAQMATGAGFSHLRLYSDLSVLRQEPSFQWGNLEYGAIGDSVFSYVRQAQGFDGFLVVLNFGPNPSTFNLNEEWSSLTVPKRAKVVLTSANFKRDGVEMDFKEDKEIGLHRIHLQPSEGFIVSWAPGDPQAQAEEE